MVTKIIICIIALAAAVSLSARAFADDFITGEAEKTPRQGIFFSLVGFAGGEMAQFRKASIGGGVRLGGGVLENLMIYAEVRPSVIFQTAAKQLVVMDTELKGQYYFWKGFYANLGAGVATVFHTIPDFAPVENMFKTGFAGSVGSGYEFRIGRQFFFAPEARIGALYIGSTTFVTVEGGGSIGWHF